MKNNTKCTFCRGYGLVIPKTAMSKSGAVLCSVCLGSGIKLDDYKPQQRGSRAAFKNINKFEGMCDLKDLEGV